MQKFQAKKTQRLDLFLKEAAQFSRKEAKRLLDAGKVFVNQRKVIIASWELASGDEVSIQGEKDSTPFREAAKNYFLKVAFEDDNLIVVEKDAGVPSEPTPTALKPDLPEIVYQYLKRTHPEFTHPQVLKLHRLDQATSGLMVYGKSNKALPLLEDFKKHNIHRSYLALVEGRVKNEQGHIDAPLVKLAQKRGEKMKVGALSQGAKVAATDYRVLQRYPEHTLLQVDLQTGRTHQVRAHLAHLGHPVVGDFVYGKNPRNKALGAIALHSYELGFTHPVTKKKVKFRSKPPKHFRSMIDLQVKNALKDNSANKFGKSRNKTSSNKLRP